MRSLTISDIAVASQRRLIEESPPQRQPVARADDAAAGDTGKDLDVAKDIQLRQTRQYTEMIEGCAEPTSRERQTYLTDERRPYCGRRAGQQRFEKLTDCGRFERPFLLKMREGGELLRRRFQLPQRRSRNVADGCGGVLVAPQSEARFRAARGVPPCPRLRQFGHDKLANSPGARMTGDRLIAKAGQHVLEKCGVDVRVGIVAERAVTAAAIEAG